MPNPNYAKGGGSWSNATNCYVKHNGSWVEADEGWKNINGTWTKFYDKWAGTTTLQFSNTSSSVSEGNSSTSTHSVTVSRSGNTSVGTATVDYATSNLTATAGSDYTAASGTLSFGANVTSQTISIAISGDTTVENNETFKITLSNPTANDGDAALGSNTEHTVTITNDDSSGTTTTGGGGSSSSTTTSTSEAPTTTSSTTTSTSEAPTTTSSTTTSTSEGDEGEWCLLPYMLVKLVDGSLVKVIDLNLGDLIESPDGFTEVTELIKDHLRNSYLIIENELHITSDHPILVDGKMILAKNYAGNKELIKKPIDTVYIGTTSPTFNVYCENNVYIIDGHYGNKS